MWDLQNYWGTGEDEERAYPYNRKRKQSKPVRSSLGNLFYAEPQPENDGLGENDMPGSKMGMEEYEPVRTFDPNSVTCVRCGRDFSSANGLAQHARWCRKRMQNKKPKAFPSKVECSGGKNCSCFLCGKVCPSVHSLGGHSKGCVRTHARNHSLNSHAQNSRQVEPTGISAPSLLS